MLTKYRKLKEQGNRIFGRSTPENVSGAYVFYRHKSGGRSGNLYEDNIRASLSEVSALIDQYRSVSLMSEVSFAINEIVDEAIVCDGENPIIRIRIDPAAEFDEDIARKVLEAWDYVYAAYDLEEQSSWWFQRFYVDSRLYLEKVKDERGRLVEIRYIDPRKITLVTIVDNIEGIEGTTAMSVVDEFFYYFENASPDYVSNLGDIRYLTHEAFAGLNESSGGRRIEKDSIIYVHSDIVDTSTGMIYGYLHKAIKPANMLAQMEDFVLIHRMARSPQRLAFYIDAGTLPPEKAMQHVKNVAASYRNNVEYDPVTGKVNVSSNTLGMVEDLWFARLRGQRVTEVDTIGGDAGGGPSIDDLAYYKEKLMTSLMIPPSRFAADAASIVLGVQEEVTREEIKFSKFIQKLRGIFLKVYVEILKEYLVTEGVVTRKEFDDEISGDIQWIWTNDSYYAQTKELNVLAKRAEIASQLLGLGEIFSPEWVKRHVMRIDDTMGMSDDTEDFESIEDEDITDDGGDEEDIEDIPEVGEGVADDEEV